MFIGPLCTDHNPELTNEMQDYVAETILEFLGEIFNGIVFCSVCGNEMI